MKTQTAARLTRWANRLVFLALAVSAVFLQQILQWYSQYRTLTAGEAIGIMVGYYGCAPVVAFGLWNMERILTNILAGEVFIRENVKRVSNVRWCCGIVALICVYTTICYLPLIFVTLIMAFLCLVISVLVCAMDAAVTIREENDLTI
jgi:hypothetical protein